MTNKERKEALRAADDIKIAAAEAQELYPDSTDPLSELDKKMLKDIEETKKRAEEALERQAEDIRIADLHSFYSYGRDRTGEVEIKIDNLSVVELMKKMGYFRYDQPDGSSVYVCINNFKIRLIKNNQEIIDAFEDYIKKLPMRVVYMHKPHKDDEVEKVEITADVILRKFYKSISHYFSDTLPRLRPSEPIEIMHDTKHSKYLYYRNCIVRITAKGIEQWSYDKLSECLKKAGEENGKYIWETSILDRDYLPKYGMCGDFNIFCNYLCGINTDGEMQDTTPIKRLWSLKSIFGYLMHDNYECNLKAILFIDMNKDNNGMPTGGTGKGILGKALSFMLNRNKTDNKYIAVGGKTYDQNDKFRYSDGDLTTQLIHIEDIKGERTEDGRRSAGFDFINFFNDVTDGADLCKKGKDKQIKLVKIMLSTNHPVDTSPESCKRRLVIFELDNYFNSRRTPENVFGHRFFETDWKEKDWAEFDNFMIDCIYYYMSHKDVRNERGEVMGVLEPPLLNYKQQLLKAKLSDNFVYWWEEKIRPYVSRQESIEFAKEDLFHEYEQRYPGEFSSLGMSRKVLTRYCKFYCMVMSIPSAEKRSTKDLFILYPNKLDPTLSWVVKI